jgi:hypothetical protein
MVFLPLNASNIKCHLSYAVVVKTEVIGTQIVAFHDLQMEPSPVGQ